VGVPEISKTVDQALRLVETLSTSGPMAINDLSRHHDISRTVVYRLLTTLELHGFVRRSQLIYSLGPRLFALARQMEEELRNVARAPMSALAESINETIVLVVRDGSDALSADVIPGRRHLLQVNFPPGYRYPLTKTASGRAILAFLPGDEREQIITGSTTSPADRALLLEQLAQVRHQGFALSSNEYHNGLAGLAVPVYADDGVVASLAIVAPLVRSEAITSGTEALLAAATQISERMNNLTGTTPA
jgi:DNA-binding IclR family transcriptional regulator